MHFFLLSHLTIYSFINNSKTCHSGRTGLTISPACALFTREETENQRSGAPASGTRMRTGAQVDPSPVLGGVRSLRQVDEVGDKFFRKQIPPLKTFVTLNFSGSQFLHL